MRRPRTSALLSTLGVAVLLIALSWELGETKFEWLIVPFVMPGMFLAAIVFPAGVHSDHALMWLGLAEIINFIFAWMLSLFVLMFLQNLIFRRREH
jgi:hypothetical protein